MNFNGLNSYLKSNQLPAFSSNCLNMGGGGFGVIDDFVIGGEGGVVSASKVANVNGDAEVSAAYGMFSCGYVLPLRSKLIVYPMTGLAWGGSGLTINYANNKTETYGASKMFVTAEINVDLFMINDKTSGTRAGFKTGVCFGYQFNPQTSPWQDDAGNYSNMPNTFMEGFYFKLKIGGGGLGTKSGK